MTAFKPSQLPVNTIVEVPEDLAWSGQYIKVDNPIYGIYWEPLGCEDCQGVMGTSNTLVDERFTDFKILSYPASVVEYMNEEFAKQTGSGLLLQEALEAQLPWKHLSSFDSGKLNDYYEINELGQVRTAFNGATHYPRFDKKMGKHLVTFLDEERNEVTIDPIYFVKHQFNTDLQL